MALNDLGNVPASSVLPLFWTSHDLATGATETMADLAVTDIEVYKGTSMTQRASDAGYVLLDTDGIDIDTTTGLNGISIDLGDNTDAGFYTVGSFFNVVVGPVTIDTRTVTIHLATFRIVEAEATTGRVMATTAAIAANAITAASMAADAGAEIADAVWDEDATGHQTGGTFGQAIGDPGADATTIYQSVVTDAAGTNIAADIIAIEGQTDDIGVAGAGLTAVPWNAAWDAEVQSEVQDALDAAVTEPGQGNPASNASLNTKIGFLYKAWRNRSTQTSSEYALYADDATTKDQEAIVSDNGTTFDRGEVSTGA